MARKKKSSKGSQDEKLLTLSEIGKRTGISMSTLIRYKKEHQDKIPSVGKGRKQRYPKKAIPVFREIYKSGRKKGGRKPSRKRRSGGKGGEELLSLAAIGRETGISYPTLLRYVKNHGDKIPSVGKGRKRRYRPEAVAVFKELRKNRGRWPEDASKKAQAAASRARQPRTANVRDETLGKRIKALEEAQENISEQLQQIIETLRRPLHVTIEGQ